MGGREGRLAEEARRLGGGQAAVDRRQAVVDYLGTGEQGYGGRVEAVGTRLLLEGESTGNIVEGLQVGQTQRHCENRHFRQGDTFTEDSTRRGETGGLEG